MKKVGKVLMWAAIVVVGLTGDRGDRACVWVPVGWGDRGASE
jgi:hypothetical protein